MPSYSERHRARLLEVGRLLAAENRLAPETRRSAKVAVRSWSKFAEDAAPTEELVYLYVVDELSKNRKVSGVKSYLSHIKRWFADREELTELSGFDSRRVKEALRQGTTRMRRSGNFTKHAKAVKESEVKAICDAALTFEDKLFAAILVCLFFNVSRGAEYVYPAHTRSQLNVKLPMFADVDTCVSESRIRIMSRKNDQFRPMDLVFNSGNTPDWALATLFDYLKLRSSVEVELTTFPECFLRMGGVVPTSSWLMRRLKAALGEEYTTHGLRAGGATRMAMLGYTAFEIQVAGGWTSDAFLSYIADNPALAMALARRNNLPQRARR